jgi:HAE1 family hydrophobic/amphiphilic exporter-1
MTRFFLSRPIFAIVCSAVIIILGLVAIPGLPISQYPQITPPVVTVTATYIGASPESVESAVTIPLENAINGVEGLRYISSTSSQGTSTVTATFNLGTNLDIAATDVQNAVQTAMGQLPAAVTQTGISVNKNNGSFVMAIAFESDTSKYDNLFLSNYAELNVVNDLKRVPGVSSVLIFGQRRYAMRVWLNPKTLQAQGLAASDVVNALEEQNVTVAAGSVGGAPEASNQPYTYAVNAVGRLSDPQQFKNIILRTDPNGGFTKLGDVARVELGAEDYSSFIRFDGNENVVGLGVQQLPSANALDVAKGVRAKLDQLSESFPPGVHYKVAFDTTLFVRESIKEVVITLLLSIALVVLVIYLFLQSGRATIIPAVTIPISLIGTFFVMTLFGFTINTITLFGLTLAAGLVVDDAIVVIENIARYMTEHKKGGVEGAKLAMDEIQSAVVASSLVLFSVFTPVAFFPGTTGLLYKQFALTIAASITISLFAALTLAPVLSSMFLRDKPEATRGFFGWFNRQFTRFKNWYRRTLPFLLSHKWTVAACFGGALLLTYVLFKATPTGFIPQEDQGYFLTIVQAPEGSSLAFEHSVSVKAEDIIRANPYVADVFDIGGFSFTGAAPNKGIMFIQLKPWDQRTSFDSSVIGILYASQHAVVPQFSSNIPEAAVIAFPPPAIFGLDTFGFSFELEDRGNVGLSELTKIANRYIAIGNAPQSILSQVNTQFRNNSPQLQVDVDRNKVKAVGASLTDVFNTMQIDLGSLYVNDFNYLNRSYRVYVQADTPYRDRVSSLQNIFVRSATGGMTPVSGFVDSNLTTSAPNITHYNLFRNIEINGSVKPGYGSGQRITEMQKLAKQLNPAGVGYEWSGLTLDEIAAGSQTIIIFALGLIFVYLVLSAQYESFVDPLIVILAVPAALLGALLFMNFRIELGQAIQSGIPLPLIILFALIGADGSLSQDAYAQVGYVMLIGLASKSAILIVEFANQQLRAGADVVTAALRAAQTRLRPILMTSIAFVIAMLPLVYASGAGSAARHSLGTVVFGGMLISTFLNLAITPVLYIIIKTLEGYGPKGKNGKLRDGLATVSEESPAPSNA